MQAERQCQCQGARSRKAEQNRHRDDREIVPPNQQQQSNRDEKKLKRFCVGNLKERSYRGNAEQDNREERLLLGQEVREELVDAKRLVEAVEAALAEDKHLLDEDELDVIQRKLIALKDLTETAKDTQVLRRSVESLSKATDEFAARRMNESIKKALSGKKIEEI